MVARIAQLYEAPYWVRALVTLAFLAAVALYDLRRHGRRATRWKESSFWLACALAGALFGAANDLVTSRVSRAYFALGKGLLAADASEFSRAVAALGAQAGAFAGLVVGGALLLANNPGERRPLPYRRLAHLAVRPALFAVAVGPLFGALWWWDVQGLGGALLEGLSPDDARDFLMVQRIHVGLYAGAALGTASGVLGVRRRRA